MASSVKDSVRWPFSAEMITSSTLLPAKRAGTCRVTCHTLPRNTSGGAERSIPDNCHMEQTTVIRPPVFYFGSPVVLLTTTNQDGTTNISPLSSAWALGDRYVLGLGAEGQALTNLRRVPEVVINLPEAQQVRPVERIAPTTGKFPVPASKRGSYIHVADKWSLGGFTPVNSELVAPRRIGECPVQIEARVVQEIPISDGEAVAVEVAVERAHVHNRILADCRDRIDIARWRPLYYTFRRYFAQGPCLGSNFRAHLIDESAPTQTS